MQAVLPYALSLAVLVILAIPLGFYIARVMNGEKTILSKLCIPCEKAVYRILRVNIREEMGWKKYLFCVLAFSGVSFLVLFFIQLFQGFLPGNPQKLPGVSWDLSFHITASFLTNTNWQSPSGESPLSGLAQGLGLTVQNFLSTAVGIAVLFTIIRGFLRVNERGLGNLWVDITRIILHLLIPLNLIISLCLMVGSMVQSSTLPPLIEMISLLLIPVALCFTFGRNVKNTRQGTVLFLAMFLSLTVGLAIVSQSGLIAAFLQNGAGNTALTSFSAIPMQLGEMIFGSAGSGLYEMLSFAILTVFLAGLMVGRTPEFLGKRIEPHEMKWVLAVCLAAPASILIGSGIATQIPGMIGEVGDAHGFSKLLFAYSCAGGNNSIAFAGLSFDTVFLNLTLGLVMLTARFVPIVGTLAIAGGLAKKKRLAETAGTLSTTNLMFVFLLILVVLLIGALSFFPALVLGPIAEHLSGVA